MDGADQLIVYFAGHGVNIGYAERWLLSDAPGDPNAAVNVAGSAEVAHRSSIGHVVFISDACRTAAEGLQAQGVTGSIIFPNTASGGPEKQVDQFWATRRQRFRRMRSRIPRWPRMVHGPVTEALVAALWGDLGGRRRRPARHRRASMETEGIPARRCAAADQGAQPRRPNHPGSHARITSNPQAWVSRLTAAPRPAEAGPTIKDKQFVRPPRALRAPATTSNSSRAPCCAWRREADRCSTRRSSARTDDVRGSKAIADGIDRSLNPTGPDYFETECGFKVQGARIVTAVAKRATAQVLGNELVRIGDVQPPGANVLIVFAPAPAPCCRRSRASSAR